MHRHAPVLRPLALLGLACALAPAFGQQRPSPFAAQPAQQQSQSPFAARPAQPQREAASLIVPGEDHAALMRRLRVLRTYRIAELRANPRVRLGAGLEANLTPVLNNPSSTFNVAQKLRALPRQVEVRAEESTFDEVEQGLLVHGSLSYRILRGACRDAGTRAQLAAAGAPCFTAEPESSRIAAFATPRNPRYVADPARRARAVAEYREKLAASRARSAARVTALRQALSDPGKRAGAVARVGAAEVRRVAALGDEQLKQEAVESARVTIEETIYVPRIATLERTPGIGAMHIGSGKPSAPALKKFAARPAPPRPSGPSAANPPRQAQGESHRTQALGSYVYLTGFTYGDARGWRKRVSVTVDWCLGLFDGCEDTYFLEPHAEFHYGFGLRFAIQATLEYSFDWRATSPPTGRAAVKVDFVPIYGTPQAFKSTGLPDAQLFDGKELVAEAGASAGLNFSVPILGSHDPTIGKNFDLTAKLPAPFTNGKFTPPAPGFELPARDPILLDIDLIGGIANYGIAGAQVLPGFQVALRSNALQFTLYDKVSQTRTPVVQSGRSTPLGVRNDRVMSSEFSLADPLYNLSFELTPGVDAHLFIDVDVWSDTWDWWVPLTMLKVSLPPDGAQFSCHDNTQCERDFSEPGIPIKMPRLPPSL